MNSEIAMSLKTDRKRIERELKHNTRMLKLAGFEVGTRKSRLTPTKFYEHFFSCHYFPVFDGCGGTRRAHVAPHRRLDDGG